MRTNRALSLSILSAVGGLLLLSPGIAQAQKKAQDGEFTVQRFEPAPGSKNYFTVEGDRMDGNLGWTAGLFFNYARNPFVVLSCRSQTDCSDKNATNKNDTSVVADMMTFDFLGSFSPIPRLQLGVRVPLSYVSGQGIDTSTGEGLPGGQKAFAVGDPTLEGKYRIFGGAKDLITAGAGLTVSFPVAHAMASGDYIGNSSPVTVGVRGIFDGEKGPVTFGANLTGVFRQGATLGTTKIGPADFRYGVGVGYRVSPIFRVLAEGTGSTQFSSANGTNTLEIDGGIELNPLDSRLMIRAGGGAGIISGVGIPQARGFVGVAYVHEVGDQDGDGIPDNIDKCPTVPEDKDGFEDADGCPDPDNDGDGIPDEKDKCPNQPETFNGYQDADGCPDTIPDRDGDGIPDGEDKCPDEGGPNVIKNPRSKYYGCPDRDGDGIPDSIDKCPDVPEPTDDLFDGSGCPHVRDRDGDGIPDDKDKCPDEPETYNGYQDEDGCPDKGPTVVQITGNSIKFGDKVEFATGKDKIQGNKSFQVLDAVAGIMKGHKEIELLEIQGHTDGVGAADSNRKLSQARSEAVVKYLVSKGVEPGRLTPKGYGPDKPLADNKTQAGRALNRRVEFIILKNTKGPAGPPEAPPPPPPAKK